MTWKPGEAIALRGMYQGQPWYIQAMRVVKDTPEEVVLLLLPGAECAAPPGYIHQKHGPSGKWERWAEMSNPPWQLEKYRWHTNRFLLLLRPGEFFATCHIWEDETDRFRCYYLNFQLPFTPSPVGFDTLDLELDLVVMPDLAWHWKDAEDYEEGIAAGILRPEWVAGIDKAREEVFARLTERRTPFDGAWLDWKPDPTWIPPNLPAGWDQPWTTPCG